MGIALVGLNHETAPVEVRERFLFPPEPAREALLTLTGTGALGEAVLLSTCNRTELYAHLPGAGADAGGAGGAGDRWLEPVRAVLAARAGMAVADADRYLYRRADREAARHLFRVASSLDSMVVGETQIQGQVRDAYESASSLRSDRVVGPVLSRLFESALAVGGRVRAETALGVGAASIPSAAVELARKIFGSLEGRSALILGAGRMSELALECLAGAGVADIAVVNRTAGRAAALAGKVGGRSAGYDALGELLAGADIVVSATASPGPVLTRAVADAALSGGRDGALLIVDLALPRDVEPAVGELKDVFLYGLDDLRQIVEANRARREDQVPVAESLVAAAADDFWRWYASLDVVPVLRAMRDRADRVRAAELEKALSRLAHLSEEDRAVVEALAAQLTAKLLHDPTVRLKEGAGNGHPVIAQAARYLFDLEDRDTGE